MAITPLKLGQKMPKLKRISVDRWDDEGNFTVSVKVNKEPKLSASRKCYVYSFEQGETDILVNIGGVDRKVRMTFMLYVKVPSSERRQVLAKEAEFVTQRGDPQLW